MSARPAGESRAAKARRRRLELQLQRASRAGRPVESAAQLPAVGVDMAGFASGGSYWNPMRVAQPSHRATSPNMAGAVPFLADADLGHAGPVLGVNATTGGLWHFDPWELYATKQINSTNVLVIGEFGTGKSGTVKQLCWRSIAFGRQVVVPSDSKGEWVGVAEAAGGQVIRLGGKHTTARLNPLDRGPRDAAASDEEHQVMVAARRRAVLVSLVQATLPSDSPLTPAEHTALEFALACNISETGDEPTLRGVYERLRNPDRQDAAYLEDVEKDGARARHVLRRFCDGDLAGLFEDASTVTLDDNAPMVVVDTSALFARGELAATCAQICTTNWIQAVIANKAARRTRYLVREEGWRDMTSIAALQAFRQWLKLSRDYGISVVTLMHKVSDFDAVGGAGSEARSLAYSIFSDISNKFIFQQSAAEQTRLISDLGLPPSHARMVMDLPQGVFLARLGSRRSFVIDAFSTSVQIERDLFSTDDAMVAVPNTGVPSDAEMTPDSATDSARDLPWTVPAPTRALAVEPLEPAVEPAAESALKPPTDISAARRRGHDHYDRQRAEKDEDDDEVAVEASPWPSRSHLGLVERLPRDAAWTPVEERTTFRCRDCGFFSVSSKQFCVKCGSSVNHRAS